MPTPDDTTRSPAGDPIYRHQLRDGDGFQLADGNDDTISGVTRHLRAHVGEPAWVYHELVSDKVHLDVHVVEPSEKFPFYTLCTSGMSDLPMTLPKGVDAPPFAELLICLPPTWDVRTEAFSDEAVYWPIRWLKKMARLPHDYKTWLGYGHTVPNGDPAEPFAVGTKLCCWLILPSAEFGEAFHTATFADGREVAFHILIPLHKEEMEFKLKKGMTGLLPLFPDGLPEVIDVARPNRCVKANVRKSKDVN